MMMKVVKEILFELQPIRFSDIIQWTKECVHLLQILICEISNALIYLLCSLDISLKSAGLRFWIYCLLWIILGCVSHVLDIGSTFVIVSIFFTIVLNLGEKKEGDK